MPLSTAALNIAADAVGDVITHLALVNAAGAELSGGGYARQPCTWSAPANGRVTLSADETFTVGAGSVVAGWRGYSALTGGTDYGGADLLDETFAGAGTYTVQASGTWVEVDPT